MLAVAVFDLTRDTAWADFVAGEVRGLAAVVVLVLLAHRAVRRAREHYADLRAALVDGGVWFARSVARAVEEEQEEARRLHGWARLRHWYDRAVDRHPSPTRRVEVFGDPTVLLRFHLGEAAAAGTAAGLGYQGVQLAVSRLTGTWPWAPVLVGMILALPVAAVLAAGALREACAGPARRRFVLARAAAAALVTTAGLLLGEGLSWSALVVRWWRATLTDPGAGPAGASPSRTAPAGFTLPPPGGDASCSRCIDLHPAAAEVTHTRGRRSPTPSGEACVRPAGPRSFRTDSADVNIGACRTPRRCRCWRRMRPPRAARR
ncbi:hypothetical protein ACF9IK_35970 [Kitasatospora hibisci]|uniref:hypothetical protein n=1 Tax=Kitasatospora hibisci TaxID=3369522 RepID=UPI0037545672